MSKNINIDPHVHTRPPHALVVHSYLASSCKKKGIDAVGITNHNSFKGFEKLLHYADKTDLMVVPGAEIDGEGFQLLVLSGSYKGLPKLDRVVGKKLSKIVDFVDRNLEHYALILAHPGSTYRTYLTKEVIKDLMCSSYSKCIDAVESWNARSIHNDCAAKFAGFFGKKGVASSDAHICLPLYDEIGAAYSTLKVDELSLESIINSLIDPCAELRINKGSHNYVMDVLGWTVHKIGGGIKKKALKFHLKAPSLWV